MEKEDIQTKLTPDKTVSVQALIDGRIGRGRTKELLEQWPLNGPAIFSVRPKPEFGAWEVYWKHLKFQLRYESEANDLVETLNFLSFLIDVYQEKLEVTHVYQLEGDRLVPVSVPVIDRFSAYDGIECRDATIQLIEESYDKYRKGGGAASPAFFRRCSKTYRGCFNALQNALGFMVNKCTRMQRGRRPSED